MLTAEILLFRDITPFICNHFVNEYYSVILLPNCHPEYYWGLLNEIQRIMPQCQSLTYTVLANAAAHLHSISGSAQMHELAIGYYSQAIHHLQVFLRLTPRLRDDNALLISVMLLYTLAVSTLPSIRAHPIS